MIGNGERKGEEQLEEKIPQWKNTLETLDSGESEKRHLIELLAMTNPASQIKRDHCPKNPPPKKKNKKIIQSAFLA